MVNGHDATGGRKPAESQIGASGRNRHRGGHKITLRNDSAEYRLERAGVFQIGVAVCIQIKSC